MALLVRLGILCLRPFFSMNMVVPKGVANLAALVFDVSTVTVLTSFSMAMVVMGKSSISKVSAGEKLVCLMMLIMLEFFIGIDYRISLVMRQSFFFLPKQSRRSRSIL